jgi:DNA uptake protein ComE-like DNA-binding protein
MKLRFSLFLPVLVFITTELSSQNNTLTYHWDSSYEFQDFEVDLQKIKQLHLNKAGYKELLAHPYLENYIVKAIFEYKDKVGKFNSVDELQNISLIYPQLFQKIEHYFTVEDSYTRR